MEFIQLSDYPRYPTKKRKRISNLIQVPIENHIQIRSLFIDPKASHGWFYIHMGSDPIPSPDPLNTENKNKKIPLGIYILMPSFLFLIILFLSLKFDSKLEAPFSSSSHSSAQPILCFLHIGNSCICFYRYMHLLVLTKISNIIFYRFSPQNLSHDFLSLVITYCVGKTL